MCVPPAGILQQVLQPEQTDIDVDVHVKKWISTLQFSTLEEALIANNNTNTWPEKFKKINYEYEPDDEFCLS